MVVLQLGPGGSRRERELAEVQHADLASDNSVRVRTAGQHRHPVLHADDTEPHGVCQCPLHAPSFPGVPVGHAVHPQTDQDILDHGDDVHADRDRGEVLVQVSVYRHQ